MKNKLIMIRFLLDEIEIEQDKKIRYDAEKKRASVEAEKTGKSRWQCFEWDEPCPTKIRIEEDCKIARRLLLDVSKEVHNV